MFVTVLSFGQKKTNTVNKTKPSFELTIQWIIETFNAYGGGTFFRDADLGSTVTINDMAYEYDPLNKCIIQTYRLFVSIKYVIYYYNLMIDLNLNV